MAGAATGATDGADPYLGRIMAGKYQILELLGQGGMGTVYKARHVTLEKTICIKTLRTALLEDPTVVSRFEREAKSASRLNHANSIQVLDFGQDEFGVLYIAMEFVSGKDLRKSLRDEFPLGEERICHIVAQVLSALAEAHAQHVIHRDLKPENIMLEQRRGEPDFVKVLDFGIAKIQEPDVPGLTRADVVCGTPLYMSPEQAQGAAFDHRADLYAIGVILYQLSTGTLPFEGTNSMEILTKHVTDLPVPPRTRRPEVSISPELEALILRAMDKDPANRPASAEEFRAEILKIQEKLRRAREDAETAAKQAISAHKAERAQALKDKQAAQLAQHSTNTLSQAPTEVVKPAGSKAPLLIGGGLGAAALAAGAVFFLHPSSKPAPAPNPSPVAAATVKPPPATVTTPSPSPSPVPSPAPSAAPTPAATPPPSGSEPQKTATTVEHPPANGERPIGPTTKGSSTQVAEASKKPPSTGHVDPSKAKDLVDEADLDVEEGRLEKAIGLYRKAIKADPHGADGYYGLFRTGLMRHDDKLTREGGEGFLRAAPHAPQASRVRTALNGL